MTNAPDSALRSAPWSRGFLGSAKVVFFSFLNTQVPFTDGRFRV